MLTGILGFVAKMFTADRLGDTVVDLVRDKTGLNELSDKERIELATQYEEATKHKSPMRRFLTFLVGCLFALFVVVWLIAIGVGTLFEITQATVFANRVVMFMKDFIFDLTMLTFGFYFGIGAVNSLRSPKEFQNK